MATNARPPTLHLGPAPSVYSAPPSRYACKCLQSSGEAWGAKGNATRAFSRVLMGRRSLGGASPASTPWWGLWHKLLAHASHGNG
eukprot:11413788-Alexandrium_andersonii.AAC.1